ncbi:hypothetical protein RN001_006347 [Aquatica leii]|uniref:Gustatory receptor n=1 Tax=Aquatica leii TaxID=1421715 RepID=A0AAN7PDZ6_9COLE|nr:hypothetical protein RN001_006347 [Aquatica leii]
MEYLDYYSGQALLLCGNLCSCYFSGDMLKVLENINNFDKEMYQILKQNLTEEYKNARFYISISTALSIIFAFSMIFLTGFSTEASREVSFAKSICIIMPSFVSTLITVQFCTITSCLQRRFYWLNILIFQSYKVLRESGHSTIRHINFQQDILKQRVLLKIMQIREKHFTLSLICERFNEVFAVQITAVIVQHFINIVLMLIYSGRHLIKDSDIVVEYIVFAVISMSWSFTQLLFLTLIASSTAQEALKSGPLIHQMIYAKKTKLDENLNLEIFFFSLQLLHQNVEFNACRCFVINETLLFAIAGAITTYLIIIIQFDVAYYAEEN